MNPKVKSLIEKAISIQKETNELYRTSNGRDERIAYLESVIAQHQKQISEAAAEMQQLKMEKSNDRSTIHACQLWHEIKNTEKKIKDIARDNVKAVRREFASNRTKIYQALIERDGAICQGCGAGGSLQVDHVLPVALGGTNELENLQMLCGLCNGRKHDTIFYYLWRQCGAVVSKTI